MTTKPFIAIIDGQPLYKQALYSLMRVSFPDAQVTATDDAQEVFAFVDAQAAEMVAASVVLVDPGLSGLGLIDQVRTRYPELQIVAISGSDDPMHVSACLGAGALAFVSKSTPPNPIVELIDRALSGNLTNAAWLTAEGYRSLDSLRPVQLTPRKLQVLRLICQGYTNKQIAHKLQIIEATAKAHVSSIFKELGVLSRTQALLAAQRLGLD